MMNRATQADARRLEREQRALEKKHKKQEKYYMASQWQLIGRKLVRHKLAVISFVILGLLYFGAIFAQFLSPIGLETYSDAYSDAPPTAIHLYHEGEYVGPFVYRYTVTRDMYENKIFAEDTSQPYPSSSLSRAFPTSSLASSPAISTCLAWTTAPCRRARNPRRC